MTFNIGSQSAANINNVGRDQHISGGQTGVVITPDQAWRAFTDLRLGVAATPLDPTSTAVAATEIRTIEAGLRRPKPDRGRIASSLERLTRILLSAGSLATAGAALLAPLQTLAQWLGALGAPVLGLISALI